MFVRRRRICMPHRLRSGVALANMLPQFAINGDIGSSALKLAGPVFPLHGILGRRRLADPNSVRRRSAAAQETRRRCRPGRGGGAISRRGHTGMPECGRYLARLAGGCRCAEGERRSGACGQEDIRSRAAPTRAGDDQLGGGAERRASLPTSGIGIGPGPSQSLCRHGRPVSVARRRLVESKGGASL